MYKLNQTQKSLLESSIQSFNESNEDKKFNLDFGYEEDNFYFIHPEIFNEFSKKEIDLNSIFDFDSVEFIQNDLAINKYIRNKTVHFHDLDHNKHLTVSLDKEEVFGEEKSNRGLLIKKIYSHNEEELFEINYDYEINSIGAITKQKVLIKWRDIEGNFHPEIKDKGFAKLSKRKSRKATRNRRETVVLLLETKIIELLSSSATTQEEYVASVGLGAEMLAELSIEINKFKNSGVRTHLTNKLEEIKTTYTMLQGEIAPGVTVIDFINDFLDY